MQLYWIHTSAWVISCKSAAFFQNSFSKQHLSKTAFDIITRNKESSDISTIVYVLLPTRFAYYSPYTIKPFYYL